MDAGKGIFPRRIHFQALPATGDFLARDEDAVETYRRLAPAMGPAVGVSLRGRLSGAAVLSLV